MARRLLLATSAALVILALWSATDPSENSLRDLYLYNAIWIAALLLTLAAPLAINRIALSALALAITFWGLGSLFASLAQFDQSYIRLDAISHLFYLLFYPLICATLLRLRTSTIKMRPIELLDSWIFSLGFLSIAVSILALTLFADFEISTRDDYLLLLYTAGDCALALIALLLVLNSRRDLPHLILISGALLFATTDIYYLNESMHERYSFGEVYEYGWLLGLLLAVASFYFTPIKDSRINPIPISMTTLSIFSSPILCAISAMRPELLPRYILIPSIANLLLAFIRMSTALRESRRLTVERSLARTDELTGLANRRALIAELDHFEEGVGALLLLDLDGFKAINDRYGHEFGDLLLRSIAIRFSKCIPVGSLLARLGGDEFGAIIYGPLDTTIEIAYALSASLTYPCVINGEKVSVGVSIGHVFNDGAGALLQRADSAMYLAKRSDMAVVHS